MVALGNTHLDYDSLVRAYLKNGNNPLTNAPMDWSGVVQMIEKAPLQKTICDHVMICSSSPG